MSNLSENLKDLMAETEIGTPALAKATGIDASTLRTFLRGDGLPYVDTLVRLAEYFHCSTDYLLGLTDAPGEGGLSAKTSFFGAAHFSAAIL